MYHVLLMWFSCDWFSYHFESMVNIIKEKKIIAHLIRKNTGENSSDFFFPSPTGKMRQLQFLRSPNSYRILLASPTFFLFHFYLPFLKYSKSSTPGLCWLFSREINFYISTAHWLCGFYRTHFLFHAFVRDWKASLLLLDIFVTISPSLAHPVSFRPLSVWIGICFWIHECEGQWGMGKVRNSCHCCCAAIDF